LTQNCTKQKRKTKTKDSADFFPKKFSFFIKTEKFNPEVTASNNFYIKKTVKMA